MDIKDVRVVVQWRLTCDAITLWQRFGRAGRDHRIDLETTGVLLAEKDFFDVEKEKRSKRRKKREISHTFSPSKCQKTSAESALMRTVVEYPSGDSDHDQSSDDEVEVKTLQSKYSEAQAQVKKKKRTKAEVHPVMDDIVNADYRKLSCRRVPIMAYLENNKAGD